MSLISAGSISLDRTFKEPHYFFFSAYNRFLNVYLANRELVLKTEFPQWILSSAMNPLGSQLQGSSLLLLRLLLSFLLILLLILFFLLLFLPILRMREPHRVYPPSKSAFCFCSLKKPVFGMKIYLCCFIRKPSDHFA